MNAVIYYSNTGESKKIAQVLAQQTKYDLLDLTNVSDVFERVFDNAVVVFPVHCQNIPATVRAFLKNFTANNLALVATYGKMCHGNVLYEAQKLWCGNIVAAAYVPTKHSYLTDSSCADTDKFTAIADKLRVIADKFNAPQPIKVPRAYKNVFAGFFPALRSRMGVKLYKTDRCNACGKCDKACERQAIHNGKPNGKCIRCLKCVMCCPQNALAFSLRMPMRLYLKKKQQDELKIYV